MKKKITTFSWPQNLLSLNANYAVAHAKDYQLKKFFNFIIKLSSGIYIQNLCRIGKFMSSTYVILRKLEKKQENGKEKPVEYTTQFNDLINLQMKSIQFIRI